MLNQPQVGVSPFPQPSEYAKQYTDENVAQKNVLPPPPIPSEFTIFGEECNFNDDMIRSLQSQKMQQLFASSGDWRSELKQLNRSAMAAFLDLLDVLVRCPNHPERLEKISNIRLLFINMHHLINEYRPVQARDTLLMIVRDQVKAIEEVNQRFQFNLKMGCEVLMYSSDELTVQNEISHVIKQELVDADDGVESKMDIENVEGPIDNKSEFEALEVDETRETADEREEAVIREIAYLQFLSES